MGAVWYISIEQDDDREAQGDKKQINGDEEFKTKKTKQNCTHDNAAQNKTSYERVCAKKDKYVWIPGVKKEIEGIYNACQKKYTIRKQAKISGNPERLRYTKKNSYQCCVE